jgi:Zn ribbon nucleic-acid-binding protein
MVDYGFHRQDVVADTEKWASLPINYVGSSVCNDCHQDKYSMWEKGNHDTVACENCHGPAREHLENSSPETVDESRGLCGLCHARIVSRPSNFPQVNMDEMGGDEACDTCHNPHEPRAGMPPEVTHDLEGRTDCESCHAPHEPLVELPPEVPHDIEDGVDCASCHGPHGDEGEILPIIPHSLEGRDDCLVCHSIDGIKPIPEDHVGRTTTSCLNCHRG